MSSYILSALERDFYKEAYIRRLHKDGYPATKELLLKFNKKFYDDHGLQGEKRRSVGKLFDEFRRSFDRAQNNGTRLAKGKPELKQMISAVMTDRQQKRAANGDQKDDREQEDDSDLEDDADQEQNQLINDLDDIMADKDGTIAVLEIRNEELAITLKMKDEECQQLEEENRALKEALQKKQAQQLKNSDVAKLEDEKRSLEEKIRSLEEALHKKDQMLETASKVQDVLTSFINKPTQ